jgi:uncharacterized protein (UPF0335 family)
MAKKGAEKSQAVAMGHNSGNLKSVVTALEKLKKESDDIRMRILNAYNAAEDQGFERKALKALLKERMKPLSAQTKAQINEMRELLGDLPLFNAALARFDEEHEQEAA